MVPLLYSTVYSRGESEDDSNFSGQKINLHLILYSIFTSSRDLNKSLIFNISNNLKFNNNSVYRGSKREFFSDETFPFLIVKIFSAKSRCTL